MYKSVHPLPIGSRQDSVLYAVTYRQSLQSIPVPMSSYRQAKTPRLRWLCCNIVAANIQPPPSPAPMSFYRQEAVIAVGVDFMSIRSSIRTNVCHTASWCYDDIMFTPKAAPGLLQHNISRASQFIFYVNLRIIIYIFVSTDYKSNFLCLILQLYFNYERTE